MTLGEKQRLFVRNISNLIEFAYSRGYEMSFGDAFRDKRVFGEIGESKGYGHRKSGHKQRLSIDFNLFKDSVYLTSDKDHEPLGIYWESLHPLNRWGGRFSGGDGNHYSMEHNGVM